MGGPSTRVRLRVIPGSESPGVVGRYGEAWKLRVSAPPEGGKANQAALALLARTLGLAPRNLRLVTGHGGRDKTVEITGLTADEAERRLAIAP